MNLNNTQIDVLILCGGWGTRLRKVVNDKQKCMVEINGEPFLNFLIDYLYSYGIKRIILCIGYMANTVKQYYEKKFKNNKILFSEEKISLGTAGAVRNAQSLIEGNPFLVMNGDSICRINLKEFLTFHVNKGALASIALTKAKNADDVGLVELDNRGKILAFHEKIKNAKLKNNYFINAGIYIFNKKVLPLIPENENYSLEYDLFPNINKCYGYVTDKTLIDIGTPRGYRRAQQILKKDKKTCYGKIKIPLWHYYNYGRV